MFIYIYINVVTQPLILDFQWSSSRQGINNWNLDLITVAHKPDAEWIMRADNSFNWQFLIFKIII